MAIRLRRGLAADRTSITPEEGEPIWTTDTKLLYIGDGSTAGGVAVGGGGGGGGTTTWITYGDANHNSADGEGYDIQAADITADHDEDVSGITTYCEFMNGQDTWNVFFVGEAVYISGGFETIDRVPTLGHTTLRRINGKLILYY